MAKTTAAADTVTAAQALIGAGLEAALGARRKAWFGSLDEALSAVAERVEGFDAAALGENEAFLSTVASATRLALEAHGTAKLEALRNTVLNAAAGGGVDELSRATFTGYLERMSDLHIRILRAFGLPHGCPEIAAQAGGGLGVSMEWTVRAAFQPYAPDHAIQTAIKELQAEALLQPTNLLQASRMIEGGVTVHCIKPQGAFFLQFISPAAVLH